MQTTGWEIWKSLIGPLFAVVLGYVVSAFNKVSKADFQKAVADVNGHWAEKYAALEKQLETFPKYFGANKCTVMAF